MSEQLQQAHPFLEKIVERSSLESTNDAHRAANVVFRIMRDMMSNKTDQQIKEDLKNNVSAADKEVVDFWRDQNIMVGFFSRLSPAQNLHLKPGTFLLRLREEGALPEGVSAKEVAQAVFSATKEILPQERNQEIAGILPGEIRELWQAA